MKNFFYLFFYSLLLFSCGGGNNTTRDYNYEFTGVSSEILDGDYCAEIEYYNPDTGTNSTYTLPIEVSDGYLTRIKWSNGGWLDNSHFTEPEFDGDTTSFTDDRGNDYTVTIISDGSCT